MRAKYDRRIAASGNLAVALSLASLCGGSVIFVGQMTTNQEYHIKRGMSSNLYAKPSQSGILHVISVLPKPGSRRLPYDKAHAPTFSLKVHILEWNKPTCGNEHKLLNLLF